MADWTGWKCDRCGKPYIEGQALYSLGYNKEQKLVRHMECHTGMGELLAEVRGSLRKLSEGVSVLKQSSHRNTGKE